MINNNADTAKENKNDIMSIDECWDMYDVLTDTVKRQVRFDYLQYFTVGLGLYKWC